MLFDVPVARVRVYAPPSRDWDVTDQWGVGVWGPYPTVPLTDVWQPPAAAVSASAPLPVISAAIPTVVVPVALVTVQGKVPLVKAAIPTVTPPVAQVTVTAPVPTFTAPAVGNIVFTPPTAIVTVTTPDLPTVVAIPTSHVTASAPTPALSVVYSVAVALVTASAPAPAMSRALLPPAAQITVSGPVPVLLRPSIFSVPVAGVAVVAGVPGWPVSVLPPAAQVTVSGLLTKVTLVYEVQVAQIIYVTAYLPVIGGIVRPGHAEIVGQISRERRPDHALLAQFHGQFQNVLGVSTVRGRYTFSSGYATGGETVTFPIQRVVVSAIFAKTAGGRGIIWTGTKLQAWNLDANGNPTTEIAAGTDLSSVSVPMIVSVIAH